MACHGYDDHLSFTQHPLSAAPTPQHDGVGAVSFDSKHLHNTLSTGKTNFEDLRNSVKKVLIILLE
jgi:hypothetical protein